MLELAVRHPQLLALAARFCGDSEVSPFLLMVYFSKELETEYIWIAISRIKADSLEAVAALFASGIEM